MSQQFDNTRIHAPGSLVEAQFRNYIHWLAQRNLQPWIQQSDSQLDHQQTAAIPAHEDPSEQIGAQDTAAQVRQPQEAECTNPVNTRNEPRAAQEPPPVVFFTERLSSGTAGASEESIIIDRIKAAIKLPTAPILEFDLPQGAGKQELFSTTKPLIENIRRNQPQVVVAMGGKSLLALGIQPQIEIIGTWQKSPFFDTPVMPVYHPKDMIEDPQTKKTSWAGLQKVMRSLK